jgi:16S rRNA (uracil1498-N3)-methyltransferase
LRRVFVECSSLKEGEDFEISKRHLHYLIHVLRAREGTRFVAIDLNGESFLAEVVKKARAWRGKALERLERPVIKPETEVVLVPALLKGDRNELVVQKAVEIGASSVVFFVGERSVPQPDEATTKRREQRLNTVSAEASRQCGLSIVPVVKIRRSLPESIEGIETDKGYFLDELYSEDLLFLRLVRDRPRKVCVVVGPEGSFSDAERALLLSKGFLPSSLGPRILRAETASIVAVTVCMVAVGDMGEISDRNR